jgi:amino acid transporter
MSSAPPLPRERGLIRAIGVPGLSANIINITIGGGIFVLPALAATGLGPAAPIAFVLCAIAMGLIATSFALAGSRVSLTGGLYAYIEVAFGPYIGFIAGVFLALTLVLASAALANAFAGAVGAFLPAFATSGGRTVVLLIAFVLLALINIRGVRFGVGLVSGVTICKLMPLFVFVTVGAFFIKPSNVVWPGWPGINAIGQTVLLLIFAFAGVENALVPSGEVKNPARTVPRAIFIALIVTTLLYIAIQLVTQGVLAGETAQYRTAPLAEAASRFLGGFGRTLILTGATISMFGSLSGGMLASPRIFYAFGRDGFLPAIFAKIHPRYHTPYIAIVTFAMIVFALSSSSTFERLVVLANTAVLLLYLLCCAAAWELVRRDVRADGQPFTFAGQRIVPILASAVIIWILSHGTLFEFAGAGAVLIIASIVYLIRTAVIKRRLAC